MPALAVPLLAAVLWALSAGAPLHPGRTGAAGGLAAGALAAALYSLYCDQDTALFVLPAYGAAIADGDAGRGTRGLPHAQMVSG